MVHVLESVTKHEQTYILYNNDKNKPKIIAITEVKHKNKWNLLNSELNRACKLLKFVSMVSMFLTISGGKQNNCCNGA